MSYMEFLAICGEYLIDPSLAMEVEDVQKAVKAGDKEALEEALKLNF